MTSVKQYIAAVQNGSKSRGPLTPGTKAQSAQNAVTHGLTCSLHGLSMQSAVLANESQENADKLLQRYLDTWQPATDYEMELAEELAVCRWRLTRAATIESGLFDLTIGENREQLEKEHDYFDEGLHIASAFRTLSAKGGPMNALNRYESRLRNAYSKIAKELAELQGPRSPQMRARLTNTPDQPVQSLTENQEALQNEPEPQNVPPQIEVETAASVTAVSPVVSDPNAEFRSSLLGVLIQFPEIHRQVVGVFDQFDGSDPNPDAIPKAA